ALQRAGIGGGGSGELPVFHHRAEHRSGPGPGRAARSDFRADQAQEEDPYCAGVRGHRRAGARREQGRRAGKSVPGEHSRGERGAPRAALLSRPECDARRRGAESRTGQGDRRHRALPQGLETVERRRERTQKAAKAPGKPGEEAKSELALLDRVRNVLNSAVPLRAAGLSAEELARLRGLFLLTEKPVLYVANIAEQQLAAIDGDQNVQAGRRMRGS